MKTKIPLRRGLAMLELTLALPILLFIMALIINYGTIAAWKVREHSVARLAVWQSRWPRSGSTDPRPLYWPAAASMETSDQGTVAGMDDSRVDLPVARGVLPQANVNSDVLDPTRGLHEGSADLTRKYALLGTMGSYTIKAQTWLIDNKWQYQQMGLCDNRNRRIPVLYALSKAPPPLVSAFVQSVMAILQAPFLEQLRPLDNDPDFIYYNTLFGWGGPPNFYSWVQVQPTCTTDHAVTDPDCPESHRSHSGQRSQTYSQPGGDYGPFVPAALRAGVGRVPGHSQAAQSAGFAADGRPGPVADPGFASKDQRTQKFLQTIQASRWPVSSRYQQRCEERPPPRQRSAV